MRKCKYVCMRFFLVKNLMATISDKPLRGVDVFIERVLRNFQTILNETEYAVRITKEDNGIYYGKISKRSHTEKHELTPLDIVEQELEDWPFAEFICEPAENQIIVIRMAAKIFTSYNKIKEILTDIFTKEMQGIGYDVRVEPLVSKGTFWNLIKSNDQIYCVSLRLLSPNLFGANSSATELLKEVNEICNNTDIEITVSNDDGDLKVKEENFESYVKYAEQGGGAWVAQVGDERGIRTVRSGQNVKDFYASPGIKDPNERLEQVYGEVLQHITLPGSRS